jgi:hypothetical protein
MKVLDGLNLANQQINAMADGSAPTDAVTLQQMQAFVRGLDWKASCRVTTTANITVASPGATIDGITMAANDRVLLKNQTAGAENGIYQWNGAAVAMTRTPDAVQATLTSGAATFITEGTTNHDTSWVLTTPDPITVGTTTLTWAQFGGGLTYTAGNGISIAGAVISVVAVAGGGISVVAGGIQLDYTKTTAKFSTSIGDGTTTTFSVVHGLGTTDIQVTIKDLGTNQIVAMTATTTDTTHVGLTFPVAPTTNQYRVTVMG